MRRTKANRALTFVMAAALLIGSIHGVGAKEQSKDYDAPGTDTGAGCIRL